MSEPIKGLKAIEVKFKNGRKRYVPSVNREGVYEPVEMSNADFDDTWSTNDLDGLNIWKGLDWNNTKLVKENPLVEWVKNG